MAAGPVEVRQAPLRYEYARELVRNNRLAEAYELLQTLMDSAFVDPAFCASGLAWSRRSPFARSSGRRGRS